MGKVQICLILANRAIFNRIFHTNRKRRQYGVSRECMISQKEKRSLIWAYFPSGTKSSNSGYPLYRDIRKVFSAPPFLISEKAPNMMPKRLPGIVKRSAFTRQCLGKRRIGDLDILRFEADIWNGIAMVTKSVD
jgi:hypothetical protein